MRKALVILLLASATSYGGNEAIIVQSVEDFFSDQVAPNLVNVTSTSYNVSHATGITAVFTIEGLAAGSLVLYYPLWGISDEAPVNASGYENQESLYGGGIKNGSFRLTSGTPEIFHHTWDVPPGARSVRFLWIHTPATATINASVTAR